MTDADRAQMFRKMKDLRLPGLTDAYREQSENEAEYINVPFEERFSQIIDRTWDLRIGSRTDRLERRACLPMTGMRFSDYDDCAERSLNRLILNTLETNEYIRHANNVIITGAAGTGKTFISTILGAKACDAGLKVRYTTTQDAYEELRANGSGNGCPSSVQDILHANLVILDEFLLLPPSEAELHLLYRLIVSSERKRSLIFCSHYTFDGWYQRMGCGPVVESILDRLNNGSYFLPITSTISMRERYEAMPEVGSSAMSD